MLRRRDTLRGARGQGVEVAAVAHGVQHRQRLLQRGGGEDPNAVGHVAHDLVAVRLRGEEHRGTGISRSVQLLADAATAENPNDLYKQAEAILIQDMALAPTYHYAMAQMIKPDIRGVPLENVMSSWYAKDMYRVAE